MAEGVDGGGRPCADSGLGRTISTLLRYDGPLSGEGFVPAYMDCRADVKDATECGLEWDLIEDGGGKGEKRPVSSAWSGVVACPVGEEWPETEV